MGKRRYVLKNILWILVLCIGIAFIYYGCSSHFGREEWEVVLEKATNICFQCIGLG